MSYHIYRCLECGREVHVHRKNHALVLKNLCEHIKSVKDAKSKLNLKGKKIILKQGGETADA